MNLQRVAVACIATALYGVTPAFAGAVTNAFAGGRPDHLICYKMTDKLAITAAVDMIANLQPQFTQRGCTLVKPVEFCVPATKQNVQPPPTANGLFGQPLRQDYICYQAKCEKTGAPASQLLADQFGVRPAVKFKATKVCVPATKFPVLCGAPGSRTCSGACPAGQQCTANATGGGCDCQPAPCGGSPDKSGICGGTCPDAQQVCRSTTSDAGRVACVCQQLPPPPCGKNPLTGSCGGDCTDPTLKCLPDDAGADCVCRNAPAQFCGPVVGATCGGSCPNPDDRCTTTTDPNKPCICEPGPCHQDPLTGACTGTCDPAGPGGTCHLDADKQCTCGPPPCGIDPATGQCGGPCPAGEICAPNAANQCGCSLPCRLDNQNVCGGACPPGQVCDQQGQDCTCVQPPPCNFGAEVAGFCSGACPPGQSCHTKEINKRTLACLCLDN